MDVFGWWIGVYLGISLQQSGIGGQSLGGLERYFELPIRLAVELVGPDEAGSRGVRGSEEHDISWDSLVLFDEHQVASP